MFDKLKSDSEPSEKIKKFYSELSKIDFGSLNFSGGDLGNFSSAICPKLKSFSNLCLAWESKGSQTTKCLKSMGTAAIDLQNIITAVSHIKGVLSDDVVIDTAKERFKTLYDSLIKTGQTTFPSKFTRSTLDYEPTLTKLGNFGECIYQCWEIFITLCNEHNCNLLLDEAEKSLSDDQLKKRKIRNNSMHLEQVYYLYFATHKFQCMLSNEDFILYNSFDYFSRFVKSSKILSRIKKVRDEFKKEIS